MNIDPSEIRVLVRLATRRTGTPFHDEDLEQDATLKVMEAFRRQIHVRHPRAFLRKIVADAVRDYWRRRRTTEELDAVDDALLAHTPQLEDKLDRQRQETLLRQAVRKLDPQKQKILELYYNQECSVAHIARIQKRSVSAVKMELLRSRRLLATMVGDLARRRTP
jgi:RNA polymerase sigma factor (sigma-70 family)